jgi:hypothetical protein
MWVCPLSWSGTNPSDSQNGTLSSAALRATTVVVLNALSSRNRAIDRPMPERRNDCRT